MVYKCYMLSMDMFVRVPSSPPGGGRHVRLLSFFFRKLNSQQLLFEEFFLQISVFGSVEP